MLKPYRAPWWMRGRHLQTIFPAAWMHLAERDLPTADEVSACVICDFPRHGGHVGFSGHMYGALNNRRDWLPERILCFLEHGN